MKGAPKRLSVKGVGDGSMRDAVRTFQRELITSRLELHGGKVKAARESLGLTKATFHRYMKV